jgi:transcription elongation GreA/GreB family factor
MSRAFTREQDDEPSDIGERPISEHRNLVTPEGLRMIEAEAGALREELAKAGTDGEREKIASISRDLRYWSARRESAEISVPDPESDVVRFGMSVTVEAEDGTSHRWKIVGEDEADATKGKISHVSPMAVALFGKGVGDLATVNGKEWEITALEAS